MRIEFHEDYGNSGAIIAGHASNGAILGTGNNKRAALACVVEACEKALHEINDHKPLDEVEQRIVDQLFDAAEGLRAHQADDLDARVADSIRQSGCPTGE